MAFQGEAYLLDHAWRFAATYETMKSLVRSGTKVLSIGAGSAYVESVLRADTDCEITVVDLPECLDALGEYYTTQGLTASAANLMEDQIDLEPGAFDIVLSGEFIEHLPEPPSLHFQRFGRFLRPGGHFVVTTPNLGSISHILRLMFMRPTLPAPEETFGPVAFENEGVHRREYMPGEIRAGMKSAGLAPRSLAYTWYHWPQKWSERLLLPIQYLISRFRPCMILVGTKRAAS
jgi:SAM-dependent methyltransferase